MMKKNLDKFSAWFNVISKYPKINLSQAQELYKKLLETDDMIERKELRNQLLNSTFHAVLYFVKNSQLEVLENATYDMDDIISTSIEFYIKEVDNGILLKVGNFSQIFNSNYYTYLTSVFVPQKQQIEESQFIGLNNFGELMHIYLEIKSTSATINFIDYLNKIKSLPIGEIINSTSYLEKCFEIFENIYSKTNIDDNDLPSVTKLKFMRHMFIDASLKNYINETDVDFMDYEDSILNEYIMNDMLTYIFNDSNLTEKEKNILIAHFGLYGHEQKTLEGTMKELGYGSCERVRQIEAKSLRKLRNRFYLRNLYEEK